MKRPRVVRRAWYAVALAPLVAGLVSAMMQLAGLRGAVATLARGMVPGKTAVSLDAGHAVIYGETRSVLNDASYVAAALELRCRLTEPATGRAIRLDPPRRAASYSAGAYAGQAMFEAELPHAGAYEIDCEGHGGPATIAIGDGIEAQERRMHASPPAGAGASLATALAVRSLRARGQRRVADLRAAGHQIA